MSDVPPSTPEEKPEQPVVKITIPSWITTDWGIPFRGAFLTIAIGIAFQYLVGILLLIGVLIQVPGQVPWSPLLRIPPAVWLGFNLGATPTIIVLTGFIWIRLSVRVASRNLRRNADPARNKILERAARFAVVYGLLELAIAITLRQFNAPADRFLFIASFNSAVDPANAFFFGLLIGFIAGLFLFARSAGVRLRDLWPIRLETQIPAVVGIVFRGLRTSLKIAIPGMMMFMYLAIIVPIEGHGDIRGNLSLVPTLLAFMILWSGVDTGLTGLLFAMQLFLGQHIGVVTSSPFSSANPAWIYSGIAIPFIALFVGGMRIAREDRTQTPSQAATRGALVGIPLSLVCLVYGALHSGGFAGGFIGRAFLVSFLWGGASALGAFFEAAQRTPEQPAAPPTS